MNKLRILFMGTPDFAASCLRALVASGENIVGCVTGADRARGRGMKLTPTPVKSAALEAGLPVFQPATLRGEDFAELLISLSPDLIIVAAYGKLLPENVLAFPRFGCVNAHASLLPKYRGAAPIQWAVINGEKITGVTTMLTDIGLDTGDILLKKETEIGENETAGELFDRLAEMGAELLKETIEALERGELKPIKQNEAEATKCGMIKKEYGHIDFSRGKEAVHNLVRGMNPWPCAYAMLEGEAVKIWKTRHSDAEPSRGEPGLILRADRFNGILVDCGDGVIEILELQFPGAKRMDAASAVLGHKMGFKVFE